MEKIKNRHGKQHRNTKSTFEVGSKAGKEVPPTKKYQTFLKSSFIGKLFSHFVCKLCKCRKNDMTAFHQKTCC